MNRSMRTRAHRIIAAVVTALALLSLAACATLPTAGDVRPGLSADDRDAESDVTYVPNGPSPGADAEQIVRGFIDAASSPVENWGIAQQFLAPGFSQKWKPHAGVTIDSSFSERAYTVLDVDEAATDHTVQLTLSQTASVDENGAYTSIVGSARKAELLFEVEQNAEGEWRITAAPDGIVLDLQSFASGDVYQSYALQYFDLTWSRMVPDVRWFPKRKNTPARIVQALAAGAPSAWLTDSVRTVFAGDIELGSDAVPVEAQIAQVSLGPGAANADPLVLSRARTQLERSLVGTGVVEVRLSVGTRPIEAGIVPVGSTAVDSRPLVEAGDKFGFLMGGEVVSVPVLSAELGAFEAPLRSVVAAVADGHAAVQTETGTVYAIDEGRVDEIDSRPGLIAPTMDPFGFIWTVPAAAPSGLIAWTQDVTPHPVAAFADVSGVSHLAVSREGARAAAVVTVGSQYQVEVLGITRSDGGVPTSLGPPMALSWLPGPALGLVWLDDRTLGILARDGDDTVLIEQPVGGPGRTIDVPDDAYALAASSPSTSVRLLGEGGVLYSRSGPSWQAERAQVQVLATQLGGS